jgi:large subunit ribosomal protein L3
MAENTEQQTDAGTAESQSVVLDQGRGGIMGVKAGMTTLFTDQGESLACTVIDLRPNVITQVRTKDKDGYLGIQVGMIEKKEKNLTKSQKGHFKKSGGQGYHIVREFRIPDGTKMDGFAPGKELVAEFIKNGDLVDVTAISKGKGFAGVVKRFHFGGANASHGTSLTHRHGGSIGNRADPGKVFKNKKMAGHMGVEKVTIQNVKVIHVDSKKQILLVHGSVPGPKSGVVTIRRAVKAMG